LELQVPYDRHWHQKYPDVRNEVRDIGEVGEFHQVQAISLDITVPEGFDRSAYESQCHCYADSPSDDEYSGSYNHFAEEWNDEDTVVEGEDTEFDADQRNVVEMAENIIAL
jgi:hypothetical protein